MCDQISNEFSTCETGTVFQGLIESQGRRYSNWGASRSTVPAVYAEPICYGDVCIAVRDALRFPSPVRPVGSMLSVTETIRNDGGTLLCMRKLDDIIGLAEDGQGRRYVKVQAGCRLKKLNTWLQQRGLEIPFQAEIGEATVGSVAVADTKESSLDAPGYFSAHVLGVVYVGEQGAIRCLTDYNDGPLFYEFKCSFGLAGIVLECWIEVRSATLCRSEVALLSADTPERFAADLLECQAGCDALLAIVFLDQLTAFCDQRYSAGSGVCTPETSQPACDEFRLAKRLAVQYGFDGVAVPQPAGLIYSRADFVNEYWRPEPGERRLDFQYYEHDIANFNQVLTASYDFTKVFADKTGFVPKGWATYFVHRLEQYKKPYGLYSAGPGVSFSFDPFTSDPCDPNWQEFAKQYNRLAIHELGGAASPTQTQWLATGDVKIPKKLARERFTTAYYAHFLV